MTLVLACPSQRVSSVGWLLHASPSHSVPIIGLFNSPEILRVFPHFLWLFLDPEMTWYYLKSSQSTQSLRRHLKVSQHLELASWFVAFPRGNCQIMDLSGESGITTTGNCEHVYPLKQKKLSVFFQYWRPELLSNAPHLLSQLNNLKTFMLPLRGGPRHCLISSFPMNTMGDCPANSVVFPPQLCRRNSRKWTPKSTQNNHLPCSVIWQLCCLLGFVFVFFYFVSAWFSMSGTQAGKLVQKAEGCGIHLEVHRALSSVCCFPCIPIAVE